MNECEYVSVVFTQQLAQVGWRPIAVLLANTVFLAVFAGALLARA